jgi:hypothetical protein
MPAAPADARPESWHRHFGSLANNRAWELAEQPAERRDDAELLDAAHAAAWHWRAVGTPLQRLRARLLLAQAHALAGHGRRALADAEAVRGELLARADTPDWERALVHAVHAQAAWVAGERRLHAESHARATEALAAIADAEDRAIVAATYRQVPPP